MDEMDWKPYFHVGLDGGIFLFPFLRLSSVPSFLLATTLTALVCWLERLLTLLHSKHYVPAVLERRGRVGVAGWRAAMHGMLTFLRLLYMLVAMTFHLGLLFVVVLSLAISQFLIEYSELEHIPSGQMGAYEGIPTYELSASDVHGYPPPPSSTARRQPGYHPYARSRARSHRPHPPSVSYPDVHDPASDDTEGTDESGYAAAAGVYGPRKGDPHAAWPYLPDLPDGWENKSGAEGNEQEGPAGGERRGLWGDEARERTREIMSGRV